MSPHPSRSLGVRPPCAGPCAHPTPLQCSGPWPYLVPEDFAATSPEKSPSPDCPGLCRRSPLAAGVHPRSRAGADELGGGGRAWRECAGVTRASPRRAPASLSRGLGRTRGDAARWAWGRLAGPGPPARARKARARRSRSVVAGSLVVPPWLALAPSPRLMGVARSPRGAPRLSWAPPPCYLTGSHSSVPM